MPLYKSLLPYVITFVVIALLGVVTSNAWMIPAPIGISMIFGSLMVANFLGAMVPWKVTFHPAVTFAPFPVAMIPLLWAGYIMATSSGAQGMDMAIGLILLAYGIACLAPFMWGMEATFRQAEEARLVRVRG